MDLETRDIIKKKILDSKENVKNYRLYSEKLVDIPEASELFKEFAEESEIQAQKLEKLLEKHEDKLFNYESIH